MLWPERHSFSATHLWPSHRCGHSVITQARVLQGPLSWGLPFPPLLTSQEEKRRLRPHKEPTRAQGSEEPILTVRHSSELLPKTRDWAAVGLIAWPVTSISAISTRPREAGWRAQSHTARLSPQH